MGKNGNRHVGLPERTSAGADRFRNGENKKRCLAILAATCWRVVVLGVVLGKTAFLRVRDLSAARQDGSWLLALGMVMLVLFRVASFGECGRLEDRLAPGAEDDRKNALLFACRNTVHAVAAAGVVALLLLAILKRIAFAPPSGRRDPRGGEGHGSPAIRRAGGCAERRK
ncbi:MAG: hypothetical protein KatS3mg005_2174 [Bryobacteraceae bacterium]|nr:MAG: hypothetical protein KatS3mg005_2174 [Bryobacteraceae bacterium]